MSTAMLSMYDFVSEYRNSNQASSATSASAVSSTGGEKHKSERMTGLYHQSPPQQVQQQQQQQQHHHPQHQHQLQQQPPLSPLTAVASAVSPSKMSIGIRRTVSSAAPSTATGMGSSGAAVNRPVVGPNCVVKSLSSNTQSVRSTASASAVQHIGNGKDPHKKLDRSFSEPAEKKTSSTSSSGSQAAQSLGPSSRYKTELCRSFAEVGSCKYGDKCQFAHGEEELRTVTRHPKFKTENCKSFHSTGFCPYGPRCHFIHNTDESSKKANVQNGSNGNSNGPSTPTTTITQRMFENPLPASVSAVSGGHGMNHGISQQQPAPFTTSNSNANIVRPKALSLGSYSLGSSGEISPPSTFFTEDSFGLGTPFGSARAPISRLNSVNAFQSAPGGGNTFSFSPDSAFVSFNSAVNNANSSSSNSGSSLSFGGSSSKCIFGGSQPTLNSRYSPEPTSADETANSVIFSLFSSSINNEPMQLNEFIQRAMSPINKSSMMMYPSSPESPVDSVASEIEALKLGEVSSSFSPISSSFSTSSLSPSSASSPPNGLVDLDTFTLLSSAAPGSAVTNIPRLPTFAKFAASSLNCSPLTSAAHE
ncbi:hypothetical protein TYRP_013559 [Tyrophagus putrescentiae]|nr:hypothetical protein TYRP_013559 [Tyrophagus putrescentiae]